MSNLHDDISGQIDKRKINKLVDDEIISPEELASAEIWIECPNCGYEAVLDESQDIDNYTCEDCGERI